MNLLFTLESQGDPLRALLLVGAALLCIILLLLLGYRTVKQGEAIIRTGGGQAIVSFSGLFSVPLYHTLRRIDITVNSFRINTFGKQEFQSKDGKWVEINCDFQLRVNPTRNDVLEAITTYPEEAEFGSEFFQKTFESQFRGILQRLIADQTLEELHANLWQFKMDFLNTVGRDLNGLILDDAAFELRMPYEG